MGWFLYDNCPRHERVNREENANYVNAFTLMEATTRTCSLFKENVHLPSSGPKTL